MCIISPNTKKFLQILEIVRGISPDKRKNDRIILSIVEDLTGS